MVIASIPTRRGASTIWERGDSMLRRRISSRAGLIAAAAAATSLFALVSAGAASAANVSCSVPALVSALNAANGSGGASLNLASGCDYVLPTTPDNGENGLPVVTSRISVNGNGATIDGSGAVRVFEVDGPDGNLS